MSKTLAKSRKAPAKGLTLGLAAFEKISAVEGLTLSAEMKQDLQSLDQRRLSPDERTRFIVRKYGKTSA